MPESLESNGDANKKTAARPFSGLRWMKYLAVVVAGGLLLGLLVMGVADARYAALRVQFQNNLKEIGLGAANFHDTFLHFPPLAADERNNPDETQPVSFHTSIIPYFGSSNLYPSIDKTVPWTDPVNRDQYATNIRYFTSPFYDRAKTSEGYGVTFIVPNSRLMPEGVGMPLEDITDGAGNTILSGGIDDTAVPAWGDPENNRDPAYGFAGGAKAFGGLPKGGAQVLFADGRVRVMSADTSSKVAKALATPAGGEVVGDY